jgi:hypothetical protein
LRVFGYLLAFVTINGSYGPCHRHVVIELLKPSPLSDVVDSSSTVEDLVQQYVYHRLADREHKNALARTAWSDRQQRRSNDRYRDDRRYDDCDNRRYDDHDRCYGDRQESSRAARATMSSPTRQFC